MEMNLLVIVVLIVYCIFLKIILLFFFKTFTSVLVFTVGLTKCDDIIFNKIGTRDDPKVMLYNAPLFSWALYYMK